MIADNIFAVRQRIARCCDKIGRSPDGVRLVCVTKTASAGQMEEAIRLGIDLFGENRVQDADIKRRAIGDKASWHLIGHLQTNKVKDAVRIFSLIHSVDSARLALAIDKEAEKLGKVQDILIQVNTSGEESKFGVAPDKVTGLIREAARCRNVRVIGLMTIAPEVADPETVRPYFRALRELKDALTGDRQAGAEMLRELSMGMTNDFEVAIEEGATMVRIGRAIWG